MKHARFHLRMIFLGCGALVCIASFYLLFHALFMVTHYTFSFDPLITTSCQNQIVALVNKSKVTDPCALQELIFRQCPAIDAITVERCGHKAMHIELCGVTPALLLNQEWVLSDHGSIVSKHFFEEYAVAARPEIKMMDTLPLHVSWRFKQWLMNIEPSVFERYSISWINDYEIHLLDKEHASVTLVCSARDQLDQSRIAAWEQIQKKLDERATPKAINTAWMADLRFEKQIIVCPNSKGGACYG